MTTLTIRDESTTGATAHELTLELPSESITVCELIRSRVFQEVKDHNARQPEHFRGLVQPTEAEDTLNGYKMKKKRMIDWKPQFEKAIEAFNNNGILIIVNDRQVESLDEEIVIASDTTVSFLRLVPLVGG